MLIREPEVRHPSPTRVRYAGLAASGLLAAGAWSAGALPGGDPGEGLRTLGLGATSVAFRLGLLACVAGTVALVGCWLRLGGWLRLGWLRAGASGPEPPGRWLAGTAALWALPLLLVPPLAARDPYSYACQGWLYVAGADPYLSTPAAGGCPWLDAVAPLWHGTTAPYGPLAIVLSAAAAWLGTQLAPTAAGELLVVIGALRLLAVAGVALLAWSVIRLARGCGVPPAPAGWLGVASPLVGLHAIAGMHHDALMAGLIVAGLASAVGPGPAVGSWPAGWHAGFRAATGRLAATGVLAGAAIGLAAAVKVTAIAVLPFVVLLTAARWPGRTAAVRPVVGCAAAFAGLAIGTGLGFGWTGSLGNTADLVQWTSLPTGVGMFAGYLLRLAGAPGAVEEAVAVARLIGLLVLVVIAVGLWLRAWRRRAETRVVVGCAGLTLAAVAVLGPVFYAWYAIAPIAVLAAVVGTRVRRWLGVAVGGLALLVLPNGLGLAVLTKGPGAVADAVLVAVLVGYLLRRWVLRREPAR